MYHRCPPQKGCLCDKPAANVQKRRYERAWISVAKHIYVICLKDRDDRMKEAAQQFHEYGLCRQVVFYRPEKPTPEEMAKHGLTSRGLYGCWRSHCTIANKVMEEESEANESERLMVFEDDLHFLDHRMSPKLIHDLAWLVEDLPTGYDQLMLGGVPLTGYPAIWPNVFRSFALMSHAYILSSRGIKRLATHSYEYDVRVHKKERGIDQFFALEFAQYSYFPQFVVQSESPSSNLDNLAYSQIYERWIIPKGIAFHRKYTVWLECTMYFLAPVLLLLLLYWVAKGKRLFNALSICFLLFYFLCP